jgi:hypothetical protein
MVQVEFAALAGVQAMEDDLPVRARQVGDPDFAIDRRGQDEALVEVGVLPDQVDPAGCPDNLDG